MAYYVPTSACQFNRSITAPWIHVEGRILVHGEEENGRSYMMLESTDAKVYAINHTRQMQEMRKAGGLRVNTFVRSPQDICREAAQDRSRGIGNRRRHSEKSRLSAANGDSSSCVMESRRHGMAGKAGWVLTKGL